jgi:hypothetical protein
VKNKSGNSNFYGSNHEIEATITISHNKSTIKTQTIQPINKNTQQNREKIEKRSKIAPLEEKHTNR